MAHFFISPQAEHDLREQWRFIANESSSTRADTFLDSIKGKLAVLAEHPSMGRLRDELRPGLRSHLVGRYLIFYFTLEEGIDVMRVVYAGRDIVSMFQEE